MRENYSIEQNTEAWEIIKIGKFSASICAALLMDKSTKGYNELIDKIIEERVTGQRSESKKFQGNYSTERGHEFEPEARANYTMRTFNDVQLVGVVECTNQFEGWVLCSPDGLIGKDKVHQIKCPIFNTQKKYLKKVKELRAKGLNDNEILYKLDSGYYKQEQFELFVTERNQAVWTSFHPSLPHIDLIIERDLGMIATIESRLIQAKQEVLEEIELLKSYKI